MFDATGSAISALSAFQRKHLVHANNVANVNTDQYKKNRATMIEGPHGGVQAVVQKIDTPGAAKETIQNGELVQTESSNVDLAEELTEMIVTETAYTANAKTIQTQDRMLGSLLDMFE